ncbi:hypothetical protein HYH03_010140 [Edaphochlamys debaryana]|uniref:Uncharacterized protein n=1 Tax=Edaphochlamys debaryana TaxID=47281 RepID=A0A835XXR0_9CHLO|nr:hypothetical protein HYH03_010140 [Edaphochlamys debaryana]|eukprot:KAG2491572.1 hypothetical protein HYH03_010140 [Edaphochlamys debaryana]
MAITNKLVHGKDGCYRWLSGVRSSCRALRELVDSHLEELQLRPGSLDPDRFASLCQDGRWLQRWPACRRVVISLPGGNDLNPASRAQCLEPFITTSQPAYARILELELTCYEPDMLPPGPVLERLLRCLPSLRAVHLDGWLCPRSSDRALAATALSSLPHLSSLTLSDRDWLPYVTTGALAVRLAVLRVGLSDEPGGTVLSPAGVTACVARITALEELTLCRSMSFSPAELRHLMDALPPSVRRCCVERVGRREPHHCAVALELTHGLLSSFEVTSSRALKFMFAATLQDLVVTALLPSRALGPRLPCLRVRPELSVGDERLKIGPSFSQLASCCDQIQIGSMSLMPSSSPTDALALARTLGVPEALEWGLRSGDILCVRLRDPTHPSPSTDLRAPSSGGGSSGRAKRRALPPAADVVLRRAVQRIAAASAATNAAPGSGPGCKLPRRLLVLSPAMQSLAKQPQALSGWLRQINDEMAETCPGEWLGPARVDSFRPLPTAAAVLLECSSAAAAEAARRLMTAEAVKPAVAAAVVTEGQAMAAPSGGAAGGSGGAGAVQQGPPAQAVLPASLGLAEAVSQVLQALWDGEEQEGGPGADVAGLERLRWLVRTMGGLKKLLPKATRL